MDVYSSMLADGIVFINARIDQRIAGLVISSFLHIDRQRNEDRRFRIYLNTKYGDIPSACTIVDIIEFYKKRDMRVETLGFGEIGPASALILASGSEGERKVAAHSQIGIRLNLDSFEFSGLQNDQAKAREEARIRDLYLDLLGRFCNENVETLRVYVNQESYMNAHEVMQFGLADAILN